MSEAAKVVVLSPEDLKSLIREAVTEALKGELDGRETVNLANKDWLKAEEAAQLYGLPRTWFEERGRAGNIARTKPGRYVLFKRHDVETYLEQYKKTYWPKRKKKKVT